jgi:hypothetical protein
VQSLEARTGRIHDAALQAEARAKRMDAEIWKREAEVLRRQAEITKREVEVAKRDIAVQRAEQEVRRKEREARRKEAELLLKEGTVWNEGAGGASSRGGGSAAEAEEDGNQTEWEEIIETACSSRRPGRHEGHRYFSLGKTQVADHSRSQAETVSHSPT